MNSEGRASLCKCGVSNWSWCPPTECDACTRAHADSFCILLPPSSNSTKWNPSLTGAHRPCFTPCWNKLDPHRGHIHKHTHTRIQSLSKKKGLMEIWRQNGKILSFPLPCCHAWPYFTLLCVSCSLPHAVTLLSLLLFFFFTLRLTPLFLLLSLDAMPRETLPPCFSLFRSFYLKTQECLLFFQYTFHFI